MSTRFPERDDSIPGAAALEALGRPRRPATRPRRRDGRTMTSPGAGLPPIDLDVGGQLRGFDALPHVPQVLAEIQRTLRTGTADARQVADLVRADVAMTAQILRIVNSAYYGLRRPILDLRYAVAYLGFNEIQRITLAVSVVNGLQVKDKIALRAYWRHSFYASLIAKHLASLHERQVDPGELWPAALLHDIGVLVYMRLYPRHDTSIRREQRELGCLRAEAETTLELPSHALLGGMLCERWELPDLIRDVCYHHEKPDTAPPGNPTQLAFRRIVAAAALLSTIASGELSATHNAAASDRVCRLLRIGREEFINTMAMVYDLRQEADAFAGTIA